MPPQLSATLSALGVSASPGEFAAVKGLLGDSFSRLPGIRHDPVAQVDATDMTPQEIRAWLAGLPLGQQAEIRVAWVADRLGASMTFATFTANIDDLWYPAMDDIVSVLHSGGEFMVLVLDHEERITFSSVTSDQEAE